MEKQKPGFGRAFVVLGLRISRLPASGRHYPWSVCPTPVSVWRRAPLLFKGVRRQARG